MGAQGRRGHGAGGGMGREGTGREGTRGRPPSLLPPGHLPVLCPTWTSLSAEWQLQAQSQEEEDSLAAFQRAMKRELCAPGPTATSPRPQGGP